jgi:hypothetical protein
MQAGSSLRRPHHHFAAAPGHGRAQRHADSFSDGGKFLRADAAVEYAFRMAADGADLIDVGSPPARVGGVPPRGNGLVLLVIGRWCGGSSSSRSTRAAGGEAARGGLR